MFMGELRKDPVGGHWVIIAAERAARPHDFLVESPPAKGGFCPFCEGNEDRTPPEVLAFRASGSAPDGPGWRVRVVPNKYPALQADGELTKENVGIYERMSGVGAHEVIIESPRHVTSLTDLSLEEVEEVILAYRQRISELAGEERFSSALIFKNRGEAAGASLEHSHSQLICTPVVPRRVQEEMWNFKGFSERRGRCPLCDIIAQEQRDGERMVLSSDGFVCFAPFASRFPFEMCIVPRAHEAHFHLIPRNRVRELAGLLKRALAGLETCLGDPSYNYAVHSAPFPGRQGVWGAPELYHWHIEVIPRVTHVAGFEWGAGLYINPVPPEDAARYLCEALEGLTSAEPPCPATETVVEKASVGDKQTDSFSVEQASEEER